MQKECRRNAPIDTFHTLPRWKAAFWRAVTFTVRHRCFTVNKRDRCPSTSKKKNNKKTIHTHSFAQWDVYCTFTRTQTDVLVLLSLELKKKKKKSGQSCRHKTGQWKDAGVYSKKVKEKKNPKPFNNHNLVRPDGAINPPPTCGKCLLWFVC